MAENGRVNVGLIGSKFMGKAHTHAYTDVGLFFGLSLLKGDTSALPQTGEIEGAGASPTNRD